MRHREPLYLKIYNELKKRIIGGFYASDGMFPSERELKKEFSVSHLTIRKAMGMLVRDGYIRRKSGVGTKLIHGASPSGGNALVRRVEFLSVIMEKADDFFSKILNTLERECAARGIYVTFHSHYGDESLIARQFESALKLEDSVVLLFPANSECRWLKKHPQLFKTIIADAYIKGLDAPQIISDDYSGIFSAVKYLADLGHKIIAHVSSESKMTGINRLAAFKDAVRINNLEFSEDLIRNGSFLAEASYSAFENIMRNNPDCTACVCSNDNAALGVMKAMKAMNLVPGKNFSIIGYGNFDISEALELSSIDQRVDKISKQVMFLIDEFQMKGFMPGRKFVIPTELKIRSSCVKNI
jgi:LacI family transcriptional regulator